MKKKRIIYKLVSSAAVCALLASSFVISASAAVIDESMTEPDPKPAMRFSKGGAALGASDLPSYYSSRDLGYVSSVKNQQYQDCWVYGALATYESLMLKNGIDTGDMSVNHANIWGSTRDGNIGWNRKYYEAGRAKIMPGYFTSWQGAAAQSKTPELFPGGSVTADILPTDLADYGITSIKYLFRNDPDSIKRAIMESGGISAYYTNSSNCFANDDMSYYMPPDYTDSSGMGHAIEIVGWDDNYDASKFRVQPNGNGAWLVKNSWGEHRGDNGFFWISYEDKDVFNSTKFKPTYQLKSFEEITDDKKLLQNEIFGATWKFDYTKSQDLTIFESFEFDSEYPVLDKVIFETDLQGVPYEIYYVPDNNGTPDADENSWTELYSSTTEYAGYICADFEDFTVPEAHGSVAVRMDASSLGEYANFGVCEWLSQDGKYTFLNDSKPGQSYILYNGEIMDTMDYYRDYCNDSIGATFVVKALTKKAELIPGDIDLNGVVDVNDATLLQKHIALLVELDENALSIADMNNDGYITISDVTIIQRIAAGYDTNFN